MSKDPNAQDFESMDEALSDESDSSEDEQRPTDSKVGQLASKPEVPPESLVKTEIKSENPLKEEEKGEKEDRTKPVVSQPSQMENEEVKDAQSETDSAISKADDSAGQLMPPPVEIPKPASSEPSSVKVEVPVKRDHRPLASMLPAKYKGKSGSRCLFEVID